uniref:Uncharacterized protein n=1 Tax=Nelumbo nucifera TaxID=4432 RepID=A0A822YYY0_NELNU|nr:TPA_asm: hypothetical protein HUJ06_008084 [Nelumbo nucifera]
MPWKAWAGPHTSPTGPMTKIYRPGRPSLPWNINILYILSLAYISSYAKPPLHRAHNTKYTTMVAADVLSSFKRCEEKTGSELERQLSWSRGLKGHSKKHFHSSKISSLGSSIAKSILTSLLFPDTGKQGNGRPPLVQ